MKNLFLSILYLGGYEMNMQKKRISLSSKLTLLVGIFLAITVAFYIYRAQADLKTFTLEINNLEMTKMLQNELKDEVLFGCIFTVLSTVLFNLLLRYILKPVNHIKNELNRLVQEGGDLTQKIEIESRDEIGELAEVFNKFLLNMKEIIADVKKISESTVLIASQIESAAHQTGNVSEEIAIATGEVATGATSQAHSAEEIMKVVENNKKEIVIGKKEVKRTFDNAKKSTEIAYEGKSAIQEAISHLSSVTRTVEFATDSIQKLGVRSGEIENIVTIISNIAGQTNLLALNASIEAARAGEAGKGFTVVADEVKKLAEESEGAAKSITELIKDIQAETSVTVRTMESNLDKVNIQVGIIQKGGIALEKIVENVEETEKDTKDVYEIFDSIEKSTDKIFEDIEEITSIIEETSAASEEVAAATEEQHSATEEMASNCTELVSVANKLKEEVHKFKTE